MIPSHVRNRPIFKKLAKNGFSKEAKGQDSDLLNKSSYC